MDVVEELLGLLPLHHAEHAGGAPVARVGLGGEPAAVDDDVGADGGPLLLVGGVESDEVRLAAAVLANSREGARPVPPYPPVIGATSSSGFVGVLRFRRAGPPGPGFSSPPRSQDGGRGTELVLGLESERLPQPLPQ
ncbi:hypothetical protein [Kitasatospora phosalacinea]|uniref:hypothetical protein n=1 Tax=Kitasatospora phosalacinea TaxID=2065 RepID=UPI0005242A41|nr:hypothetical protein [Kitasatospora phosalacinea]